MTNAIRRIKRDRMVIDNEMRWLLAFIIDTGMRSSEFGFRDLDHFVKGCVTEL